MPKYLMATVISGLGLITACPLIVFVFYMLATESSLIAGQFVYGDWLMLIDPSEGPTTIAIILTANVVLAVMIAWWHKTVGDKMVAALSKRSHSEG